MSRDRGGRDDGFADENFTPDPDLPVSHNTFTFDEHSGGTQLIARTTYDSAEALQQVLAMGVVEGASAAINQIDALLEGLHPGRAVD